MSPKFHSPSVAATAMPSSPTCSLTHIATSMPFVWPERLNENAPRTLTEPSQVFESLCRYPGRHHSRVPHQLYPPLSMICTPISLVFLIRLIISSRLQIRTQPQCQLHCRLSILPHSRSTVTQSKACQALALWGELAAGLLRP